MPDFLVHGTVTLLLQRAFLLTPQFRLALYTGVEVQEALLPELPAEVFVSQKKFLSTRKRNPLSLETGTERMLGKSNRHLQAQS